MAQETFLIIINVESCLIFLFKYFKKIFSFFQVSLMSRKFKITAFILKRNYSEHSKSLCCNFF